MGVSYFVYTKQPDHNKVHDTTSSDLNCDCCRCCRANQDFVYEYISKNQTRLLYSVEGITFGSHKFDHSRLEQVCNNLSRVLIWYTQKINEAILEFKEQTIEDIPDLNNTDQIKAYMNAKAFPKTNDEENENISSSVNKRLEELTNGELLDENCFSSILDSLDESILEWSIIVPDNNIILNHSKSDWYPGSYLELLRLARYMYNCYINDLFLEVHW